MIEDLLKKVAIVQMERAEYPQNPPFNPPEKYPEYPYDEIDATNLVYKAVRDTLIQLGLDSGSYGTKEWNPLGEIIKPGDNVVIKPNFVSEPRADWVNPECLVTHASVIRPVIDYCHIALKCKGSLVVADAPQSDSNFKKIIEIIRLQDVLDYVNRLASPKVDLLDLREEQFEVSEGVVIRRDKIHGDPKGYTIINLGDKSQFYGIEDQVNRIYGADYNFDEVRKHHSRGLHEYYLSNTILNADVILNLPKLKTHKKAGVTLCMKNIIGVNADKNYLPHYRFGAINEGGDEYPEKRITKSFATKFYQLLFKTMAKMSPNEMRMMKYPKRIYSFLNSKNITRNTGGSWYGNDTLWRTIIDLNNILFYADKEGAMREEPQRRYLAIIDGVIAGEGDGPLFSISKNCGIVMAGLNPILLDLQAVKLMGFDYKRINYISKVRQLDAFLPYIKEGTPCFNFEPAALWECLNAEKNS